MEKLVEPDDNALDLFFQLSSIDRRHILLEVRRGNLKLNEIAKRLDMTATETLRQLQRLTEARLLEKIPDGKYQLTSYAKLVLDASAPMDFISKFREYFLARDASTLPGEFRARFGELRTGRLMTTTMETLNKVTEVLKNAKERIDGTVEVGFDLHQQIMLERLKEGVKVRWLMQESYIPTAKSMLHSVENRPEIHVTPRVFGHVYTTERAAAWCLRRNDGMMDYSAFYGEDAPFLRWANELFMHEWENAKLWRP